MKKIFSFILVLLTLVVIQSFIVNNQEVEQVHTIEDQDLRLKSNNPCPQFIISLWHCYATIDCPSGPVSVSGQIETCELTSTGMDWMECISRTSFSTCQPISSPEQVCEP